MGMFRIADKVAFLSDGKIIEYGTPYEIRKSKNEDYYGILERHKNTWFFRR
ncbi:MAG: hypothetical protein MZV70_57940 [Desulfobacterales bacterium]|nr:hypothetical protein [Desulfobacterales bacterium]